MIGDVLLHGYMFSASGAYNYSMELFHGIIPWNNDVIILNTKNADSFKQIGVRRKIDSCVYDRYQIITTVNQTE